MRIHISEMGASHRYLSAPTSALGAVEYVRQNDSHTMAYSIKRRAKFTRRKRFRRRNTFKKRSRTFVKRRMGRRMSIKKKRTFKKRRAYKTHGFVTRWVKIDDNAIILPDRKYYWWNGFSNFSIQSDIATQYPDLSHYKYGRVLKGKVKLTFHTKVFNTEYYDIQNKRMGMYFYTYNDNQGDPNSPRIFVNDSTNQTSQDNMQKAFETPRNLPGFNVKPLKPVMSYIYTPRVNNRVETISTTGSVNQILRSQIDRRWHEINDSIYPEVNYDCPLSFVFPLIASQFQGGGSYQTSGVTQIVGGPLQRAVTVRAEHWVQVQMRQDIQGYSVFTNIPNTASAKTVKKDLSMEPTVEEVPEQATTRIVGGHPVRRPSRPIVSQDVVDTLQQSVTNQIIGSNPLLAGAATILGLGSAKRPREELKH